MGLEMMRPSNWQLLFEFLQLLVNRLLSIFTLAAAIAAWLSAKAAGRA
jgi:hypothetical protein